MANDKTSILFPVARMVTGDLYKPNTKDADGNDLVVKNGPNKGQPRVEYFLQIAIAKTGQPWWETEWGKVLYQAGAAAFPQAVQFPTFAWKVKDGDDAQPRQGKGGKPAKPYNQREGWAGHWIVGISSGFAPKIVTADGSAEITEPGAVKCGYYVQVYGNVGGNGSSSKPGIHINHNGIALSGYGQEITTGVDLGSVGFGGALPAGASTTPLAGMTAVPQQAAPGMPGVPATGFPQAPVPGVPAGFPGAPGAAMPGMVPGAPGAHQMPVPGGQVPGMPAPGAYGAPAHPGAAVPPAGVPQGVPMIPGAIAPNPAFLSVPGAPAAPVAPAAPPAAPVRTMTAKANGVTYEAFRQAGWTDEALVREQYMLA